MTSSHSRSVPPAKGLVLVCRGLCPCCSSQGLQCPVPATLPSALAQAPGKHPCAGPPAMAAASAPPSHHALALAADRSPLVLVSPLVCSLCPILLPEWPHPRAGHPQTTAPLTCPQQCVQVAPPRRHLQAHSPELLFCRVDLGFFCSGPT